MIFCFATIRELLTGRRLKCMETYPAHVMDIALALSAVKCTFLADLKRWLISFHVMCIAWISRQCNGASFTRKFIDTKVNCLSNISRLQQLRSTAILPRLPHSFCDSQSDVHFRRPRWRLLAVSLARRSLLPENRLFGPQNTKLGDTGNNQWRTDRKTKPQCM